MAERIQDFIPAGRNNRPGNAIQGPKYVTVHDTANSSKGADALSHAKYLKGSAAAALPVSWHFTVDDTRVVQHLPVTEHGWHAGDGNGPGNRSSIGIEICENADGNRSKAEANAAALIAGLLRQLGLPITAVVQHNHWSGKNCPHTFRSRPGSWESFLLQIKALLGDPVKPEPEPEPEPEKPEEEGEPMTDAERQQFDALVKRVTELEAKHSMAVPAWAKAAVAAAAAAGVIDTPEGGSLDFYRLLTVLYRKGLL
ncbi:N-acetylmuramoyl-L-alanine amidase [Paenibacillus algorifonticola]|uniref:peptidoglycan recognition protein family protein n=1 Tax=Paenibacillus algorifonticola TaxID=684063 RepID=UPI003D2AC348